jgi:hypothetical protein
VEPRSSERGWLVCLSKISKWGRVTRERDKDDVLAAARPLPPDEDVLIDDLTEDEDHLFLAAVLDA